jgi:uncharacterized protein (TIGR04255 family)
MLFADNDTRYFYTKPPLVEVISQLRFPAILSIGTKEPAEFQEAIRREYPRYAARPEYPMPKLSGVGTSNPSLQTQPPVTNYSFVSQDGKWKINLTNTFIALSTVGYQRWEDFAQRLDVVLAHFVRVYQPAFFQRIGLRYVNAFSRKAVGMEDLLWDDLIQSAYLGILGEPDVDETTVSKCSLDVEMELGDRCRMKLHAGPGMLKQNTPKGPVAQGETRFILDGDFSASGNLALEQVPAELNTLHSWAVRLFQGAITRELHEAMGPMPL